MNLSETRQGVGTMSAESTAGTPLDGLHVDFHRDVFFRSMLRELAGTLEEVVGMDEAAGFISVVGQRVGDQLNAAYRTALDTPKLDRPQIADVLVDLKRRIDGEFRIVEQSDEKLVFVNTACPFGDKVLGRPALCMMTSNVFGSIAAENLGYAKLVLQETIAQGHGVCRAIVHLQQTPESIAADGREYYGN